MYESGAPDDDDEDDEDDDMGKVSSKSCSST